MAPDDQPSGRRRALLVATGSYADPALAALRAPTGDVASLAAVLGDEEIGGFEVQQLIDRPAEDLRREIETFFGDGRPQDLLLLYVSGHGVLSQSRRFYFATANTSLQLLRSTAVEDGFVNDVMQSSRARSIVLVLDCCHSGAFGKGLVPKSTTTVDVEHRFEGRGRVTLSASTELEYAFEETDPSGINELDPAAPGSLFTRSVVDGLRSGDADIDEDGRISVDDLYDYVCRRVRERSVHQTPGMAGDVRGQIVIARSSRRSALPPELTRAVESNMAGIRAGAVDELKALLAAGGAEAAAARGALERLAEDDSRRVAAAALAALGRSPPPQAPPREPPPPPAERARPAAPRGPRRDALIAGGALAAVAAVVVALVVLLPGGESSDDSGPSQATPYNFSGNGYQDVVAAPLNAGTAEVLIASAASDTQPRAISAAEAGVDAGPKETFGTGLAGGDFNGDSKADLAIGTPNLDVVSVLYGNGDGGVSRKALLNPPPKMRRYGIALLARDLNDDQYTDLVVGAAGVGSNRGRIQILLGSSKGVSQDRATVLTPPSETVGDFGYLLRSGDLNGDDDVDLVEGGSGDNSHLSYCLGQAKGPPTSCQALIAPDGDSETNALAVADLDNDGKDDIIQSDTTLGGDEHGGGLRIWKGDSDAPQGTPRSVPAGEVTGDPGFGKPASEFGFSVDAGVLPGDDEYADIVVGVPGYPKDDGSVVVIRGGPAMIAHNHPEPIVDSRFVLGSDVALLALESSDSLNLVIVADGAGFGQAVQYVAGDGKLKPITGFAGLVSKDEDSSGLRIARNAGPD